LKLPTAEAGRFSLLVMVHAERPISGCLAHNRSHLRSKGCATAYQDDHPLGWASTGAIKGVAPCLDAWARARHQLPTTIRRRND